jgi:signal transduction histidine kinase
MDETELLRTIRPIWIHRTTLSLAKGAGLREDLRTQLERFFDLMEQVVATGDPAWLDSILTVWAASLTQTDLESGTSSMTQFIKEIMLHTTDVCRETLDSEQALDLLTMLVPGFAYAFEKAAHFEMQVRVAYVSNQLKQVQQTLEKLDRSKSDFIAVAAHELKTPLTLIEGYTAMLRESRDPKNGNASDLELLNGINSGTRRLKTIIDDMIDVSLIDNNLMQLNFQPVWINRLLAVCRSELELAMKERDQAFEVFDFEGCSEMTFGDPERLMQVFFNVLSNSVKYTPDGGRISITGRKLPGFIEVIVHDTGIGIDPEDQSIIFEKFTRLGNTSLHSSGKTKFKGGGPGLGLHIARGIIEAHGGAIWVESSGYDEEKLPGSTFHILLPLLTAPPDSHMARLLSPLLTNKPSEEKAK